MKCSYCNNEVPNGAIRCPNCGASGDFVVAGQVIPKGEAAQPDCNTGSDFNSSMQMMMQQQMLQQQMMMNQQMQSQRELIEKMNKSSKSKTAFILLSILLAGSGFNNFYIGRTFRGLIQLILACTVFGWFISALWNLIEAFTTSKDSSGKELS